MAQSSPQGGYVLKFISGKYQGGEFPLEMDREILIGRGSDLDMVLVEDMVSRRHARITSFGGELIIEDLGSTNGSFVNGEKITRSRLKEGDRILVGTSIIKLVRADQLGESNDLAAVQPTASVASVADLPDSAYKPTPAPQQPPAATMTGLISGKIEEVPLHDLLQLFSTSRKSGVLTIHSHKEGRIFLREGRAVFASVGSTEEVPPLKVFYRLLWWKTGTFVLEPPVEREFPSELEISTEGAMMEGMRQLDEINNLGPDVPDFIADLRLPKPLVPPLRSLTPELLDTMQLALNYVTVEDVLDHSLADDLDTMQDIVYLLRNGYIEVV